ncbi:hypothetical protein B0F90DRAFT_283137 [Multifurca ochricompacta]|uniref:Uncharacterized protein n=1 Tax=Multifurca ochricompacta TaxID=376703 RepID=A0AAD4LWG2_9AGAM|nr:hypothetical protein B0F90DRAFT_283137 [Multifurca ochricompacta]
MCRSKNTWCILPSFICACYHSEFYPHPVHFRLHVLNWSCAHHGEKTLGTHSSQHRDAELRHRCLDTRQEGVLFRKVDVKDAFAGRLFDKCVQFTNEFGLRRRFLSLDAMCERVPDWYPPGWVAEAVSERHKYDGTDETEKESGTHTITRRRRMCIRSKPGC